VNVWNGQGRRAFTWADGMRIPHILSDANSSSCDSLRSFWRCLAAHRRQEAVDRAGGAPFKLIIGRGAGLGGRQPAAHLIFLDCTQTTQP
jgi:hypothetical protein